MYLDWMKVIQMFLQVDRYFVEKFGANGVLTVSLKHHRHWAVQLECVEGCVVKNHRIN